MEDSHSRAEFELLQEALSATASLGLTWEVSHSESRVGNQEGSADAQLCLNAAGRGVRYLAQVKRSLRPATIGAVQAQLQRLGSDALLVADYVTPPLADRLREAGIQFIDAAGNAHLYAEGLLVWVKGQRPRVSPGAPPPEGRVFQPSGLQVVFALLCDPDVVDAPYRELGRLAAVAHGTVGWVMPELRRIGFVAEIHGRRRLVRSLTLLSRWLELYPIRLRPKHVLTRYRAEHLDWAEPRELKSRGLLLGGEPAAAALTGNLRPATVTLFGPRLPVEMLKEYRLHPDPHGNVELIDRFWCFEGETPGLAPVLLVYADLLSIGDARCLETAEMIYGRIVDRLERT